MRARIRQRLQENAEVVGTDEAFFEDEEANAIRDLYTEQSGVLDDSDDEVDLASYAWQIWKQATQDNPDLAHAVESLPPVVYSARPSARRDALATAGQRAAQGGALVYVKSPEGNDHLAWVGTEGQAVTESQFTVLRAAECAPDTPAVPRAEITTTWWPLACNWPWRRTRRRRRLGPPVQPAPPRLRAAQALRSGADEHAVPATRNWNARSTTSTSVLCWRPRRICLTA